MRKLLLTTALALPMSFGAAFAQDTAPATDPAMEPAQAETTTTEPVVVETETTGEADMEVEADESAAAASAAEKVEMEQAANEWRVDWITGTNVTSPEGENIGSISDLILDGETGQMKAAIIGVGGFLGIGEKQIALPWADLVINSDAQQISSDLTREEADAAPEYVFRDREAASGDMVADPAGTEGTAPAADPMATDTAAEPMTETTTEPMTETTTEPVMEVETTEPASEPAMETTEPADATTSTESNVEVTTVPADEASSEMTEEVPPMEGTEAETEVETETETAPAN